MTVRAPRVLLIVLVLLVFGRSLGFGFTSWDDDVHLTANPRLGPSWPAAAGFWTAPYSGLYVPLTYTVLCAEAALSQRLTGAALDPAVFHAGCVLLHALAAILVFLLLRRLVRADGPALAGAALWAVHPVQVESVAWVSETRGLLAGVLGLVAILEYLRERERGGMAGHAVATVCFVLALLAKPAALVIPPLAAALVTAQDGRVDPRAWRPLVPWLVIAAAAALLTKRLQPDTVVIDVTPLAMRPVVALDALAFYLGKVLWPFGLAIDYGRSPSFLLARPWFGGAWIAGGAVAGLVAAVRPLRRRLGLPLALFVLALAPVLGLVPFGYQYTSTVADRYLYLAMLGPALLASRALAARPSRAAMIGAAAVVVALAILSFRQAGTWRSNDTLYRHALAVNPGSLHANNNLGLLALAAGDADTALTRFDAALATRDDYVPAWINRAKALAAEGRDAEAAVAAERAVALAPDFAPARVEAAAADLAVGREEQALAHLRRALVLRPDDPDVLVSLARYGRSHGDLDGAEEHLSRALAADPAFAEARVELAACLWQRGDESGARMEYEAAIRADPSSFEAHRDLGKLRMNAGDVAGAAAEWRAAVALRPEDAEVRGYLDRLAAAH